MIIKQADLIISAGFASQFPASVFPEIAFAGRSNVGKSSLINALLARKKLAHTSSKPGKTQTINFYLINSAFHLVDLPGYGYAAVSKVKKAGWGELIDQYLKNRPGLGLVVHLVDARHEPSALDKQMAEVLRTCNIPSLVVATKRDKLARSVRMRQAQMIKDSLHLVEMPMMFSVNETGCREELWQKIIELVLAVN